MQISLADKDKCSMLFLGEPLNLTYDEPGPVEVDFNSLSEIQKKQIFFNWKRGVLIVNDEDLLKSIYNKPIQVVQTAVEKQVDSSMVKVIAFEESVGNVLREREVKLRALLRKPLATIKKQLLSLSNVELRELVEIEKKTKNRKKLIDMIDPLVNKHRVGVGKIVGTEDIGNSTHNPYARALDNSMEVIESETEEVMLIPSDKELNTDG